MPRTRLRESVRRLGARRLEGAERLLAATAEHVDAKRVAGLGYVVFTVRKGEPVYMRSGVVQSGMGFDVTTRGATVREALIKALEFHKVYVPGLNDAGLW